MACASSWRWAEAVTAPSPRRVPVRAEDQQLSGAILPEDTHKPIAGEVLELGPRGKHDDRQSPLRLPADAERQLEHVQVLLQLSGDCHRDVAPRVGADHEVARRDLPPGVG